MISPEEPTDDWVMWYNLERIPGGEKHGYW